MRWSTVEFDESTEIQNEKGEVIADVWFSRQANLIATAPEMLEALEEIYKEYKMEWLKDIIKKAKNK